MAEEASSSTANPFAVAAEGKTLVVSVSYPFNSGASEYNGYFKLLLALANPDSPESEDNPKKFHVVDGATWDGKTSGPSICVVNRAKSFKVAAWHTKEEITADQFVVLHYSASTDAVEIKLFDEYPDNNFENIYFLLGRVFVKTSGEGEQKKTSVTIQQDHTVGVAALEWMDDEYRGYFKVIIEQDDQGNAIGVKVIDGANPGSNVAGWTDLGALPATNLPLQDGNVYLYIKTIPPDGSMFPIYYTLWADYTRNAPPDEEEVVRGVLLASVSNKSVIQRWTEGTVRWATWYMA